MRDNCITNSNSAYETAVLKVVVLSLMWLVRMRDFGTFSIRSDWNLKNVSLFLFHLWIYKINVCSFKNDVVNDVSFITVV